MARQKTLDVLTAAQKKANLCVELREEAVDAKEAYESGLGDLMQAMRSEGVTEVSMRGVTFRRVESEKIKVEGKPTSSGGKE